MTTKKFRKSARGQDCTFRIPGVCNYNPETTVLCHAPSCDKGIGFKSASDSFAAFGCFNCHNEMDGRTDILKMTKTEKRAEWFLAIDKTQSIWRQMGLLPKE